MNERTEQLLTKLAGDLPALCSIWNDSLGYVDYCRPGTALRLFQSQMLSYQIALGLKVASAFAQTFGMKMIYTAIDYACLHGERYPGIVKVFPHPEDVITVVHGNADDLELVREMEKLSLKQRFEATKASIDVLLLTQRPTEKRPVGDKAMVSRLERSLDRYIHMGMWAMVDRMEKSFPDCARIAKDLLLAEGIERPR
mgnify:CR=1 FL=1